MEQKEAIKKAQSHKPKENLLTFQFTYGEKFVLPYKDGLTLMTALQNAEIIKEDYSAKRTRIQSVPENHIRCVVLSRTEYEQIKISQLLDVPLDDVKQFNLEIT